MKLWNYSFSLLTKFTSNCRIFAYFYYCFCYECYNIFKHKLSEKQFITIACCLSLSSSAFYFEFSLFFFWNFSQYSLGQVLIRLAWELSSLSSLFLAVKPIGTRHVKLWQSNNGLGGSAWAQIVRIDVAAKSWHKAARPGHAHTRSFTRPPRCQLGAWHTAS